MKIDELENTGKESLVNPFYISLSDLMMLLCVFFILIVSISKVQLGAFERMSTGFSGKTSGTLAELAKDLEKIANKQKGVHISMDDDGVRLDLDTNILFDTGSAALKVDQLDFLLPILNKVKGSKYILDVEGHTDDVPLYRKLGDNEIETNWSLSGRRAASLIHHLMDVGFDKNRLRIIGYGSTKPKEKIEKKEGEQLYQARAKNRRVSILIR